MSLLVYKITDKQRLTISGFEAVNQPNSQVAFGSELSCFLPHVNHHLCKALAFIQLDTKRHKTRVNTSREEIWGHIRFMYISHNTTLRKAHQKSLRYFSNYPSVCQYDGPYPVQRSNTQLDSQQRDGGVVRLQTNTLFKDFNSTSWFPSCH